MGRTGSRGRPSVHIDLSQLENVCALQATDEEIAAYFRVTQKTIQRRKASKQLLELVDEKTKEKFVGTFVDIMERGKARGKVSVRRALFAIAAGGKHGAAAAAIFLAKNLLGYRDVKEVTGPEGGPIETNSNVTLDLTQLTSDELRSLRGLVAKSQGSTSGD